MKMLVRLLWGALFLPLFANAEPLVISASGSGASEVAAIAATKRQVANDAQSAGLLLLLSTEKGHGSIRLKCNRFSIDYDRD